MSVDQGPSVPPEENIKPVSKLGFEDKLDEDFMVILQQIKENLPNLQADSDRDIAQLWLERLCGEAFDGVDLKRSRNIYLTRLACQMQEPDSRLHTPFHEPPEEGKLPAAEIVFKLHPPPEQKKPEWIKEVIDDDQLPSDISHMSHDGRTYLATRTMKNGGGAFGYLAVTVADDEPLWEEQGDVTSKPRKRPVICRDPSSPQALISRLNEEQKAWSNVEGRLKEVTNKRVIENIQQLLESRRSPEERDGLLHFYDILLESISQEMDNCGCGRNVPNPHVQHLMDKLECDLEAAGEYSCICSLPADEKRMQMLQLLYQRTEDRKKEVVEREAALDRMERSLQGLGDEDDLSEDDVTGDSLWLNAIEQGPSDQNMKRLLAVYPPELVERFVELLAIWRQDMIRRCRNRHESVVAAMKKELKAEVKLGLDKYKCARDEWMKVAQALQDVQAAQRKAKEEAEIDAMLQKQVNMKHVKGRSRLVTQLQDEFNEAQERFENERNRSEKLREQINVENQRIDDAIQLSEAAIEQLQSDGEALRNEIVHLEYELEDQEGRIVELDELLDTIC